MHFQHVFLKNAYFREKEKECEWGRREREGDAESTAGSRLRAVSTQPDVGPEPTNLEIMTWAEVSRPTNRATHVPPNVFSFTVPGYRLARTERGSGHKSPQTPAATVRRKRLTAGT